MHLEVGGAPLCCEDFGRLRKLAALVKSTAQELKVPIGWGSDWKGPVDMPHYEFDSWRLFAVHAALLEGWRCGPIRSAIARSAAIGALRQAVAGPDLHADEIDRIFGHLTRGAVTAAPAGFGRTERSTLHG